MDLIQQKTGWVGAIELGGRDERGTARVLRCVLTFLFAFWSVAMVEAFLGQLHDG